MPSSPDQITSRVATVKTGDIHYVTAGTTGHPIVLLHGSGPGATGLGNFRPNIGALAARHQVIAPDMPGWGKSVTQTFDQRDHSTALLELLDELGIEKAAIAGNSMGGATTLKFAIEHPDRVSHVITMGASAPGPHLLVPQGGPSEGIRILQAAYRDPSLENMKRLTRVMTFDPAFATDELAAERSEAARANQAHLDNFIAGMGKPRRDQPSLAEIATITAPALLIHGRDDRVNSYEQCLRLLSVLPESRALLMSKCGHWAQLEHAAEFNRVVIDFIAGN